MQASNPRTYEQEAKESGVSSHSSYTQFKASLGYIRICLKKPSDSTFVKQGNISDNVCEI